MDHHDISMGRDALFTMLRQHGLLIRKRRRKIPRTTFSDHWQYKFPNLIIGLPITHANRVWVSDITYVNLKDDFAYLSLITDAYSHLIVGYHLSKDLKTTGCLQALKRALRYLSPNDILIHHSDRGCQYCSIEYVSLLELNNISVSMTQNSDPRENAIAERVNGILKQELLDPVHISLADARIKIDQAIEIYNHERLHASIDMLTPSEAYLRTGNLKKHWKNYYQANKQKEVEMT
jgi:transposase InsO family protein